MSRSAFIATLLIVSGGVLLRTQETIRPNDRLVLNSASVFIYSSPGGSDNGEVTRQDLRSNGDVIIAQELRTYKGETWVQVRITAGPQQGQRYKMPDSVGWFRGRDVSKAKSAQPYGAPPTFVSRLQKTIGVERVADAPRFIVYLKPGFWSGFDETQRRTIAKGHIDNVWQNRPKSERVQIMEGANLLAESTAPGRIDIR